MANTSHFSTDYLVKLRHNLSRLSETDLRNFYFDQGIDYDSLPTTTNSVSDKARELVRFLDQRGRIPDLVKWGKAEFPNLDWGIDETCEASNPDLLNIESPIRLEFIRIPAGEFLMGSHKAKDTDAYDDELPQHRVNLDEYHIGKYPITVARFAAFVKATNHKTTAEQEGSAWNWTGSGWKEIEGANWQHPRGPKSDVGQKQDHPVMCVSWDDAMAFCKWLSQATGRTVQLPSEAQWEKAARASDGRIYPWGNESPDDTRCNFNMNVGDITPVGKYSPRGDSPYDCADMAGNVWEWTRSLWGKDGQKPEFKYPYTERISERENINASRDYYRLVRGGAWDTLQVHARCANRYGYPPFS